MNRLDFAGRSAVVTGGARGIGAATAARLLDSGASVALWDLDTERAETTAAQLAGRGTAFAVKVDVTDPDSVTAGLAATLERLPRVDVLVNNAGIAGPNHATWEYPLDAWRQVIDLDLNGVFYCCRTVVPHMLEHGYGRIVNVASIAGKEGNPRAAPYAAAKAGVIGLTKALGKELAQRNVLVNCVTPAAVKTEILEQVEQSFIDYMLSKIPMGRLGEAEEIAALIAWLCSEDCSFSTAAVFDVSGGRATY